jgi:hypothetical protein
VLDGLGGVPEASVAVFELCEQGDVLPPRQLSNGLLDNCIGTLRGPGVREAAHVVEIRARKAGHLRKLASEVRRQAVDDFGAPSLPVLALEDLMLDLPVEPDQLAVDRGCRRRRLPTWLRRLRRSCASPR